MSAERAHSSARRRGHISAGENITHLVDETDRSGPDTEHRPAPSRDLSPAGVLDVAGTEVERLSGRLQKQQLVLRRNLEGNLGLPVESEEIRVSDQVEKKRSDDGACSRGRETKTKGDGPGALPVSQQGRVRGKKGLVAGQGRVSTAENRRGDMPRGQQSQGRHGRRADATDPH